MKQPNLGYADVKLDFACMHPAGCACRVSLCDYYDHCDCSLSLNTCLRETHLMKFFLKKKNIPGFSVSVDLIKDETILFTPFVCFHPKFLSLNSFIISWDRFNRKVTQKLQRCKF